MTGPRDPVELAKTFSRGDPYLSERIALERGERINLKRLYQKMGDPGCGPPPFEVLSYLARYHLEPPQGPPPRTQRQKTFRYSLAQVVGQKYDELSREMSRDEALQWLLDDLHAKGFERLQGRRITTRTISDLLTLRNKPDI